MPIARFVEASPAPVDAGSRRVREALQPPPMGEWMHALLSMITPEVTMCVRAAWGVMLSLVVVLHAAVYVAPYGMVPFNALPWAFHIDHNLDLDFQAVTYATVHETRFARWSHLTMPAEQVAWVIVLISLHPAALALVLALLLWQALSLREPPFAAGVVAMWAALSVAGWAILHSLGAPAVTVSRALLLVGPLLRAAGHCSEPVPPFVATPRDEFVSMDRVPFRLSLAVVAVTGIVSEFAAAMPHRLILVQAFWLAQRLGYAPRRARTWDAATVLGESVRSGGWKAYDKTRALFAPLAAPAARTGSLDV